MATIVTRSGKGSALTWVEGDDNFTNLNNDKIELTDLSVGAPATPSGAGDLSYDNTTGVFTYTPPEIPTSIGAVVEDTAPQLGGDLDANGFTIKTTSSTIPLSLTGYVDVNYSFDIQTNASTGIPPQINVNGIVALNDSTGLGYGALTTQNNTTGMYIGINLVDLSLPNITIEPELLALVSSGTAPVLELLSDGGSVTIQGLVYPNTDGTNGQVLTTDGAGNLTFADAPSGGISAVVDDTTPQLGGDLDVNGNNIFATNGSIVLTAIESPILGEDGTTAITLNHTGVIDISGDLNAPSIVSLSNGDITIAPNGTGVTKANNINYYEKVYSLGTTSGTITPDAANGNVQTITLNGNLTFSAFSNPVAGQSITLIINTGGTGRTLTSTMKFAGGEKTLSTANTTDMISVFYDGTTYWASLTRGFA